MPSCLHFGFSLFFHRFPRSRISEAPAAVAALEAAAAAAAEMVGAMAVCGKGWWLKGRRLLAVKCLLQRLMLKMVKKMAQNFVKQEENRLICVTEVE